MVDQFEIENEILRLVRSLEPLAQHDPVEYVKTLEALKSCIDKNLQVARRSLPHKASAVGTSPNIDVAIRRALCVGHWIKLLDHCYGVFKDFISNRAGVAVLRAEAFGEPVAAAYIRQFHDELVAREGKNETTQTDIGLRQRDPSELEESKRGS